MRRFALLAFSVISGCATVADLREGRPAIQSLSDKRVQAISACIADQWSHRSGSVNSTPRLNGVSLALSYVVYSNTVAAIVVDIDDFGDSRSIKAYAKKGDNNQKLRTEIASCV